MDLQDSNSYSHLVLTTRRNHLLKTQDHVRAIENALGNKPKVQTQSSLQFPDSVMPPIRFTPVIILNLKKPDHGMAADSWSIFMALFSILIIFLRTTNNPAIKPQILQINVIREFLV